MKTEYDISMDASFEDDVYRTECERNETKRNEAFLRNERPRSFGGTGG